MQNLTAHGAERLDVADHDDVQQVARELGWTDGLPIIAPTPDRVDAMLEWALTTPDHVVAVEDVKGRAITAEKVAANAVMAGCSPPAFPLVVAAVEAICKPEFLAHGANTSTGGCAVMLVVSGPIRRTLDMSSAHSAMAGPDTTSITVGRAVRLVIRNLIGAKPGELDRSTLGHPGKLSWCIAEDEEGGAPWSPLGAQRGMPEGTSSVTAFAASGPRQIMNEWTTNPHDLADTIAAEIRSNMLHYSIWAGNYALVVPPQLRKVFHDAGWTKNELQRQIHERAAVTRRDWETVGKQSVVADHNRDRVYSALPSPEHLLVISAGGDAGGFASIVPPWLGPKSAATTAPIGVCLDCEPQ